jgi:hypothetical protein
MEMMTAMSRRRLLVRLGAATAAALAGAARPLARATSKPSLVVYREPGCECCQKWTTYMGASGFAVTFGNTANVDAVKRAQRIPQPLWSCHTAVVSGYVIEGHVPAAEVRRLLAERPKGTIGLTIPDMPQSAPGMDLKPFQPYTVLAFDAQGRTTVYARHDRA